MFSYDKTVREAPLHAASALSIALADWLAFGLNVATTMHAYWPLNVGTALAAGALVTLVQRRRTPDSWLRALAKGAVGAMVVAIPLPVVGTALALAALTWAWMSAVSRPN